MLINSFIINTFLGTILFISLSKFSQFLIDNKELFQVATNIATILGIPVSIYVYYVSKKKERELREFEIYDRMDEKFVNYIMLCFENPELDIFEIPLETLPHNVLENKLDVSGINETTSEKNRKEIIAYTILISIFERYYISCMRQQGKVDALSAWEAYMELWFTRSRFRAAWNLINIRKQLERANLPDNQTGYNVEFVRQMNKICDKVSRKFVRKAEYPDLHPHHSPPSQIPNKTDIF
ncbi:hypothetical protein [Floridanema evergladense]|uniref:Uncharacterized protein n=1 Tax=Floridaenema evergladense BLCC-F167 TaxID=3153639 RepID=A0ABV4WUH7_9CYAN